MVSRWAFRVQPLLPPDANRQSRFALLAAALVFAGCASASPAATAVPGPSRERIVIATRTVDFENPDHEEPATVVAWFKLPERPGRVPAVIVAHGCAGDSSDIDGWTSELRRMGYAALALDSFTGRGIPEICTGRHALSVASRVHDMYGALSILARHPRVDPDRIALMGFSHGGGVVLAAGNADLAGPARARGGRDFAAYLAFYPLGCNVRLLHEARRIGGPIRIFHGVDDDWTPARPCRDFVARLGAGGHAATMVEYDAAHHGFDSVSAGPTTYLPNVVNLSHCVFIQAPSGALLTNDGRPARSDSPCITRGATVGYNADAHRKAIEDVETFLAQVFRQSAKR